MFFSGLRRAGRLGLLLMPALLLGADASLEVPEQTKLFSQQIRWIKIRRWI